MVIAFALTYFFNRNMFNLATSEIYAHRSLGYCICFIVIVYISIRNNILEKFVSEEYFSYLLFCAIAVAFVLFHRAIYWLITKIGMAIGERRTVFMIILIGMILVSVGY